VTVRNPTKDPVSVTGVVAAADRDERIAGAPVDLAPGATAQATVEGCP
jgi:hypothetical protein